MEICTKYGPVNTEFSKTHKCKCWLYCKDKYKEVIEIAVSDHGDDSTVRVQRDDSTVLEH